MNYISKIYQKYQEYRAETELLKFERMLAPACSVLKEMTEKAYQPEDYYKGVNDCLRFTREELKTVLENYKALKVKHNWPSEGGEAWVLGKLINPKFKRYYENIDVYSLDVAGVLKEPTPEKIVGKLISGLLEYGKRMRDYRVSECIPLALNFVYYIERDNAVTGWELVGERIHSKDKEKSAKLKVDLFAKMNQTKSNVFLRDDEFCDHMSGYKDFVDKIILDEHGRLKPSVFVVNQMREVLDEIKHFINNNMGMSTKNVAEVDFDDLFKKVGMALDRAAIANSVGLISGQTPKKFRSL